MLLELSAAKDLECPHVSIQEVIKFLSYHPTDVQPNLDKNDLEKLSLENLKQFVCDRCK
jgi:hypothetical protein